MILVITSNSTFVKLDTVFRFSTMIAEEYNVRYILLRKLKSYPQWKDLSGEVVMDIGCGDGSESTKCILQLFPRVEKIIAIDKLRRVIAAAKRENAHPQIEYHVANITKKLTLMTWYNKISKIISFHCFEFVKLKEAFRNVFFLLKPGGEGVIVLMTSNAFRDAYDEMLENPMWRRYLKNRKGPSAGFANYVTHFECQALAQEVGLSVRFCQARENTACFENDQEIKGGVENFIRGYSRYLPEDLKQSFTEEYTSALYRRLVPGREGRICMRRTIIVILVRKPEAFIISHL
ncbi:methyltransf_25 domain-containing protein [Caerostris darwini]|uniref:Methyltransf_25 domain-containing protein n=1 Tax=Caerostris darwini TaxID=1538125 RepID=A0AAV4NTQ1_9ARAC|nr:methyltransf_25 domain-containing protein [Caerostris darwini]